MRYLPILLFLAIAAGCSSNRPAVQRQTFLLQAERPGPALAARAGTLRMGRVTVASPFDERSLVYRRDDVRFETDYYNQFAADPADMVEEAAANWLRQGGIFSQVLPPAAAVPADLRLDGNVSAFYVDFQAGAPAAVLDIRWQLVRVKDGGAVLDLDCRQRVALEDRSPAGAARAYRQALQQALARLETALAGAEF